MACPDCASVHLYGGALADRVSKLRSLNVYITEPHNDIQPRGILVIVPDAFGWILNNNRILADAYARRAGATVYLPDFTNGEGDEERDEWLRFWKGSVLEPTLLSSMDAMVDSKEGYLRRL
ncbi:hypothetical protein ACLMJK_007654 [Lecanora helva]